MIRSKKELQKKADELAKRTKELIVSNSNAARKCSAYHDIIVSAMDMNKKDAEEFLKYKKHIAELHEDRIGELLLVRWSLKEID